MFSRRIAGVWEWNDKNTDTVLRLKAGVELDF